MGMACRAEATEASGTAQQQRCATAGQMPTRAAVDEEHQLRLLALIVCGADVALQASWYRPTPDYYCSGDR